MQEVFSEPSQTIKMEFIAKIVNGLIRQLFSGKAPS